MLNRLLLITQLHRSGGTLFSQLLDGHSMIQAHPHELFIGKPEKWNWPDLTALLHSGEALFESLKEEKIAALGAGGNFVKPGSNSEARTQIVPFTYSLDRHRFLFCESYKKARQTSQRLAIQLYLQTFFKAWPEYNMSSREVYTSCFLPHIILHEQSLNRMLHDFPDILMVSLLRRPDTWISSLVNHINLDIKDTKRVVAQLDRWKRSVEVIVELHKNPCIHAFATTYEALVLSTASEMKRFCDVAGLTFEPVLLKPTVAGFPVLPNSSYKRDSTGVNTHSVELKAPLPIEIKKVIDEYYMPFYDTSCHALQTGLSNSSQESKDSSPTAPLKDNTTPLAQPIASIQSTAGRINLPNFLQAKLQAATLVTSPFPYLYLPKFLPSSYLALINTHFPPVDLMSAMPGARTGNTYAHKYRRMISINKSAFEKMMPEQATFWKSFQHLIEKVSWELLAALPVPPQEQKYTVVEPDQVRVRIDLWSDRGGYKIDPHTDAPHKLATFLLYCSEDPSLEMEGTSIFVPKNNSLSCWVGKQWPLEEFNEVYRAPYGANHLFGFRKTDRSFHGKLPVAESTTDRRTIAITLQTSEAFVS